MSRAQQTPGWGPSHQDRKPPHDPRPWIQLGAIALIAVGLKVIGERLQREGPPDAISSTLGTVMRDALIVTGVYLLARALKSGHLPALLRALRRAPSPHAPDQLEQTADLGAVVRRHALRLGGGAFLGLAPGGSWVTAEPEHAVMVLGPPRSG